MIVRNNRLLILDKRSFSQVKNIFNSTGFCDLILGHSIDSVKKECIPFEDSSLKDTFYVSSIQSSWYVFTGDTRYYYDDDDVDVRFIFLCVSAENKIIQIKIFLEDLKDRVYLYCRNSLGDASLTGESSIGPVDWSVHHIWNLNNKTITLHYLRSLSPKAVPQVEMTYSFLSDANNIGKFIVGEKFR